MNKAEFATIPLLAKYKAQYIGQPDYRFHDIVRFSKEEGGTVFVYAKGRRNRGWRMDEDQFLRQFAPVVLDPEEQTRKWHRRLAKAIACMQGSGLWPDLCEVYKNLATMPYEDWKKARDLYWKAMKLEDEELLAKYPFLAQQDNSYFSELADAKLKKMNFGKSLNGQMEHHYLDEAFHDHRPYSTGRIRAGYDVSAEYAPEKQKGWYSEEYRNCGNGHYYLMLNQVYAVFCEDD